MSNPYQTDLFRDMHAGIQTIRMVDCHEHLQRESELPAPGKAHIGRFFIHYASSDLVSAGMPAADMQRVQLEDSKLDPKARWALLKPWYKKAWNTAYCECLRIAIQDLYGFEDLDDATVEPLTEAMNAQIKPGFTRRIFDRAGIDFAMNHTFGPRRIFNPDFDPESFIPDMLDDFTAFPFTELEAESGMSIRCLDDYLNVIDSYIERYGAMAGALKIPRAYDRPLMFNDVPRNAVEGTFNRLQAFNDRPDRRKIQALEDFTMHHLCRACGKAGLRIKFHCGLQEGNGNDIRNSRAALLSNLFMKYPQTNFDIYHISYPYHEETIALVKNFPNVTIDFCWMWIINPAAARRALSDMLDCVPLNKIHGFGGDFIFVEGTYAHAVMARREITRVLCEKVEAGRFTESMAQEAARMLLRDNAIDNFDLESRRKAFAASRSTR